VVYQNLPTQVFISTDAMEQTSTINQQQKVGILLISGAAVSFSLLPLFFRLLPFDNIGVGVQILARLSIGTISLLLWNRFSHSNIRDDSPNVRENLPFFALNGFVLFAAFTTYNLSIGLGTAPAKAILLIYLNPIFTAIISRLFLKEELSPKKILSILGGVTGIFIAVEFWNFSNLLEFHFGDMLALTNGVLSSLIVIIGRKASFFRKTLPLITLQFSLFFALLWALCSGILFSFLSYESMSIWQFSMTRNNIVLLLSLGLLGTTLPYIFLYSGLRYLEASITALFLLLEPISVFVLQAIFFGEPIFWWQLLGGGMLLLSGYYIQLEAKKNTKGMSATTS
jgi:drug/metabolite transporter (DMT)-like permease